MLLTLLAGLVFRPDLDPKAGRKLVFSNDFSKLKSIPASDWTYDNGPVYNDELEKYTSDNAKVEDGCLVIEARKENGQVTSSRLQSVKAWKYVYIEATAKVPGGRGTWPAIWMLNDRKRHPSAPDYIDWPDCGEIDIMENVGFDPASMHFTLHSHDYNWRQKEQRTSSATVANPDAFHTFGLDWHPDEITFYLDGKAVYDVKRTANTFNAWPFQNPFYLILNMAIGGNWGGSKGVDDAIFPAKFYIRDIKVYQ